jgi:hypothetical protein
MRSGFQMKNGVCVMPLVEPILYCFSAGIMTWGEGVREALPDNLPLALDDSNRLEQDNQEQEKELSGGNPTDDASPPPTLTTPDITWRKKSGNLISPFGE